MYKESILDFVKIPGVVGVALIQEQTQLYLYIKEQTLGEKQKTVSRSIIKVIAKAPKGIDNFEFQVMEYYVSTYELNHNLAFLVLTDTHISAINLRVLAAKQLKATLQQNLDKALVTFELLTKKNPQIKAVPIPELAKLDDLRDNYNAFIELNVTIEQLLNALNHLSQLSSNYLGPKITANYWQLTRPSYSWLNNFQINRSAEIAFYGVITEPVSELQHQLIKDWTAAFIKHCSQIIRNLPIIIEQKGLNNREKILLLSNSVKPPNRL